MELDGERAALQEEARDAKPGAIVIDEDMVRFMVHKLAMCEGPDAAVRGFVSRVVVSGEHDMWVGFTVSPDGEPPDGESLVRVNNGSGSLAAMAAAASISEPMARSCSAMTASTIMSTSAGLPAIRSARARLTRASASSRALAICETRDR